MCFSRSRSLTRAAKAALLCVFCLCCPASRAENRAAFQRTASTHFAIADFDGDRKPDLATVEIQGPRSASRLRYSIRFQLTAGDPQSIGVTAPAGGLQIVAQDVNGDQMLDLLVSTEWLHEPVAILLNDGHGRFTICRPTAFQGVRWDCELSWNLAGGGSKDVAAALVSRNFSNDAVRSEGFCPPDQCKGATVSGISCGSTFSQVCSVLGRAPPVLFVLV